MGLAACLGIIKGKRVILLLRQNMLQRRFDVLWTLILRFVLVGSSQSTGVLEGGEYDSKSVFEQI